MNDRSIGFQAPLDVVKRFGRVTLLVLVLVAYLGGVFQELSQCHGQDWPQALGPSRDGSTSYPLPDDWSPDRMERVWELDAGEGFAGPIVADGKAYLWDRQENKLRLRAVSLKDGSLVWTREIPAIYPGGFDPDKGPRATPTYADGRIFAWSAGGLLACVSSQDGSIVWQKSLAESFPGGEGYFGYGGGPIVIDETVMLNVGGREASIVGLDVETGELRWKAVEDRASYAAPTRAVVGQKPVALFVTRLNFSVLDPTDGTILGTIPFGKRGATVNAASPLVVGEGQVFLNAAYGIGAKLIRLPTQWPAKAAEPPRLELIWEDESAFASQYTTPLAVDGYLYGTTGREDFDDGQLRCIRISDGQVQWNQSDWPLAHGIRAGSRILFLTLDCRLVMIQADSEKLQELGQRQLAQGATRPLPALAEGYFLFRTIRSRGNNDAKWYAYRLQ